jgi:hypothetical protein
MYTLRTIETDGREVNLYLGAHYTIIKKGNVEPEHFNYEFEKFFGKQTKKPEDIMIPTGDDLLIASHTSTSSNNRVLGIHADDLMKSSMQSIDLEIRSNLEHEGLIKAFIDAEKLPNALPIYINKQHYIVGESGRTFQKL